MSALNTPYYVHTDGNTYEQHQRSKWCFDCLAYADRKREGLGRGLCLRLHIHSGQEVGLCRGPWIMRSHPADVEVL